MNAEQQERFLEKFAQAATGDCWEWLAGRDDKGYGAFRVDGVQKKAHRLSWELHNGVIPKGEGYHGTCVCHHCDNPGCVNPAHLFLGTNADNGRDRADKGRAARLTGETNANAKLTEADVRAIRADKRVIRSIAAAYGMSPPQIYRIRNRTRWSHIT